VNLTLKIVFPSLFCGPASHDVKVNSKKLDSVVLTSVTLQVVNVTGFLLLGSPTL